MHLEYKALIFCMLDAQYDFPIRNLGISDSWRQDDFVGGV
jgi:hypothetical protein